jgi:DNA-binding SARP family transcriptional activator
LEVEADAGPLTIAGPRRRALLALLVVHANRVVSTSRVIDSLWGEDGPPSARAQVHSLISALRQELPDPTEGGPAIETRPEGYLLTVDSGCVDLFVFEKRVAAARVDAGAGRLEQAVASYREALALWRGPALDGIEAPFVDTEAARLEELRLVVTEDAVEADLALGHHTEIVGELGALVAEHPYQERLQAALMLALYRSGRRADALEVCRNARRTLAEELGLDPGRTLQELEQAMLRDEPSLALAPRTPAPSAVTDGDIVGAPPLPPAAPPVAPPRRRARKLAAGVAVLIVAGIAVTALAFERGMRPPGAQANENPPAQCPAGPMNVTDYTNRAFSEVYHCSTTVNQAVYANPRDDAPLEVVSIMKWAPDVWVICQLKGRANPVVQGRRSDWWFYTEGDAPNRPNRYGYAQAWAFLPATVVSQAEPGRPVSNVPMCPPSYVVPGPAAVSSPEYPDDGRPHGRAGSTGTFVFRPVVGTADLAGFEYSLDDQTTGQFIASGGPATVRITIPRPGRHVVSVWVRTSSGSLSPEAQYPFLVR